MKVLLDRLEAISRILLIVATLVGGIWAVFEWLEKKQDARVSETLGYVRRFSTDPLETAQVNISVAWFAVRDKVRTLESNQGTPDDFVRRKRQLVMMLVEGAPIAIGGTTVRRGF